VDAVAGPGIAKLAILTAMCGIAGLINHDGRLARDQLIDIGRRMRDVLTHRGPDDAGLWIDEAAFACLAHRRLSILDLRHEGAQPMVSASGMTVLSFNGEIYNYRAIADSLDASFRTSTDTEPLLELLDRAPPDEALGQLRGMYAFAAWRPEERELVLARDAFGKKPLYWAAGDGVLAFASELRALELVPGLDLSVDRRAVQEYLLLQYVHAPRSIYRGVSKVPPGSFLRLRFGAGGPAVDGPHRHFAFRPREPEDAGEAASDQSLERVRGALIEAVDLRMVSDVPLGAFLSSGVDSALVVAIMARELGHGQVRTYSLGFRDSPDSEHEGAREIAAELGTDHHELLLDPSGVDLLPTIAAALDEPNGDSSCLPVHLLSEFTRRHVTVALSGDGGDELFGGYGRYGDALHEAADPLRQLRSLRRDRRLWSRGQAYVGARVMLMPEHLVEPMTGRLDDEVAGMLRAWRDEVNDRSRPLIHAMRGLDAGTYLPGAVLAKVDRMSMQHSLEVRCPLLDTEVAALASTLPAGACHDGHSSKPVLKRLLARYLPERLIDRPKKGFGLPERLWSRPRLLAMARELLLGPDAETSAFLDPAGVGRFIDAQSRPGCFSIYQVWALLVLEQWLRERRSAPARREVA
jgi:asparagine synthase (glutamine-hydrolysing)